MSVTVEPPVATEVPEPDRPRHRRRGLVLGALAVVLVVAGAAWFGVRWQQRGAEQASLEDAVRDFRAGVDGATPDGLLVPRAGVYVFRGEGHERLSLLATRQEWGAQIPVTVSHDTATCWSMTIQYSTHHTQVIRYCADAVGLHEVGGVTRQQFDFVATTVDSRSDFSCRPPIDTVRVDARPGERWPAACDGTSDVNGDVTTSAGTNTFVGLDRMRVDGVAVPAYHYRVRRSLSGGQTGNEATEVWFSARDGLPLRLTRSLRAASSTPLGDVVYTEQGHYRLAHLEPRS